MIGFGAPWGLLALAAVPALLAAYFLRRRMPPRVVSALFLWRAPDPRSEAGPTLQRFSREIPLAVELAAALAATAFLSDLRWSSNLPVRHTVIVLDGSLSMAARRDGVTVASRALALSVEEARADGGRVTVVESGPRPRVLVGPAAEIATLAAMRWSPSGPWHDPAPSLALARELAGTGARIRFITDRPVEPAPEGVEVIALGSPLPNDAFVSATRRDLAGRALVSLRVAHFGPAPARVPVKVESEGVVVHEAELTLEPGGEQALHLELSAPGPVVATLPHDALPEDGRVTLLPSPPKPVKVELSLQAGAARQALEHFLSAEGSVPAAVPGDLSFVGDDPALKGVPWSVRFGVAGEVHLRTAPFFPDRGHPLLDEVPLDGLAWAAGKSPPGRALLTSADVALITQEPGPVFHLNLDLGRSNLARSPAWPILLSNLVELRRRSLPGFARRQAALGEEVTVAVDGTGRWTIAAPEGEQALRGMGEVRFTAAHPGRHALLLDGHEMDAMEVSASDRRESDLRDRASGRGPSKAEVGLVSGGGPRSPWPLVLMVALLALDWAVTGQRRRLDVRQ